MRRSSKLVVAMGACAIAATTLSLWIAWLRPGSVFDHDTLPFYAAADLRPRWDPVSSLMRVGSFQLLDQHQRPVDRQLLDSGPTVVNLFFAGCVSVCPVTMDLLRTLHGSFGDKPPRFVSLTVSPLTDDVPALAAYADKFGLPKDWLLLTGEPKQVEDWARRSLHSDISHLGADGLPPHTERAFLVDRKHRVRGIYDARSPHEIVRLRNDVMALRLEEAGVPAASPDPHRTASR